MHIFLSVVHYNCLSVKDNGIRKHIFVKASNVSGSGSVVGIATDYGPDGRGIEFR
jgi:hypothetical protein